MTTRERKDATIQVGDKIIIDYGSDRDGRHWWKVRGSETMHGPFATKAEAVRDSEVSTFGPQCEVIEGGDARILDKPPTATRQ